MKKLFTILVVAAFLFAACGQKAETADAVDTTANVEEQIEEAELTEDAVIEVEEIAEEIPAE